jgi:subtilisin family serine protease
VSLRRRLHAHALFEGMIFVAKQKNVDVINMSIGGLPALNAGQNARCALYDRLIEQSNVQMFISMGNDGPGVNTAGDPGLCGKVLGLGAYITSDTYQRDYGAPQPFTDNLHYFSSRGPREDGGFSPELVAPGAAISSTPMWQPGGPLAGTYALPPGYSLFNGTSMAAPQATGVGALLVSAAKQAGASTSQRRSARPDLVGPVPHRRRPVQGVRPGHGPHQRRGRLGPAEDEHQDGRHHGHGSDEHDPERLPLAAGRGHRDLRP